MNVQQIMDTYFAGNCRPLYQPIFGHPEYNARVNSLDNDERVQTLSKLIRQFQTKTGKKEIHILDIGSAEGYIDLCLKKEFGDDVKITCYEQFEHSVELSKAINDEFGFDISFNNSPKSNLEFANNLSDQNFDIVFLFDIIYWTSLKDGGWKNTKQWLSILAKNSSVLLLELAGYDNNNDMLAPKLYDNWFNRISYYKKITSFKYSNDNIERPFYIASNKYVYLNNTFYTIEHYDSSFNGMRRAFLCGDCLIKMLYKNVTNDFEITNSDAIFEMQNEVNNCNLNFSFSPNIDYFYETSDDVNLVLRLKKIGANKLKLKIHDYKKECGKILNVLDNLIELESKNLYHYDLTTQNIMETKDGEAFLIDLGAAIPKNIMSGGNKMIYEFDPKSKYNSYDAFIGIVIDFFRSNMMKGYEGDLLHSFIPNIFFDENSLLPQGVKNFLKKYQITKHEELSFELLKRYFNDYVINEKQLILTRDEKVIYGLEYERRRNEDAHLKMFSIAKIIKQ